MQNVTKNKVSMLGDNARKYTADIIHLVLTSYSSAYLNPFIKSADEEQKTGILGGREREREREREKRKENNVNAQKGTNSYPSALSCKKREKSRRINSLTCVNFHGKLKESALSISP